jgi:hypothetical protein
MAPLPQVVKETVMGPVRPVLSAPTRSTDLNRCAGDQETAGEQPLGYAPLLVSSHVLACSLLTCSTWEGSAFPSRGNKTSIELFWGGAVSIEANIRRLILAFVQGTSPQNWN